MPNISASARKKLYLAVAHVALLVLDGAEPLVELAEALLHRRQVLLLRQVVLRDRGSVAIRVRAACVGCERGGQHGVVTDVE